MTKRIHKRAPEHSPQPAAPAQPEAPQPLPPLLLTIGIDRNSGRLDLVVNARTEDDLHLLRQALTVAGERVQAELLAAAEARGRAAVEKPAA